MVIEEHLEKLCDRDDRKDFRYVLQERERENVCAREREGDRENVCVRERDREERCEQERAFT